MASHMSQGSLGILCSFAYCLSLVVKESNYLFVSFRPDRQLQDIVYKMVPYLEEGKQYLG